MKHYLDIETGNIYQFNTQPTAETKYRFVEIDSSWFETTEATKLINSELVQVFSEYTE